MPDPEIVAQAPEVSQGSALMSAGIQLLNELVRQFQTRTAEAAEFPEVRIERRLVRLRKRNRALEECVAFLTSAVGMCAACFGRLAECPACRGHGQPGKLPVDPTAYAQIVVPLFEHQPERLRELLTGYAATDPTTSHPFVGFAGQPSNGATPGRVDAHKREWQSNKEEHDA
jgi:hypothetical protein